MKFNRLKSEYAQSLIVLTSGTFIAQLIPIIFYPIVSRLFTPEQFGSLSVITQIANILTIIAPGGYLYAIFIAKKKKTALNIFFFSISLSICILSVSTIILFLGRNYLSKLLSENIIERYFYIPTIMSLCIIIFQCYNEWCVRNKQFKQLSINKSVNSGAVSMAEITFGIVSPNAFGNGILFGDITGRFISALSCIFSIFKNEKHLIKFCNWKEFKRIAIEFSRFPKYIMPAKLVNTVARSIPVFFISSIFTKEQLGFFSMANMVIVIPVSVISIAVSDAFRQKANSAYTQNGSCKEIFIKTVKPLAILSIIGFSTLYISAPELFAFVLGPSWKEAGIYARYLMPIVAIEFISEVAKPIFIITGKQQYDLIWQIIFLICMIALTCYTAYIDISHFLIIFTIVKSSLFLLQFIMCYRLSSGKS